MEQERLNGSVAIRTKTPVIDLDGYPKTELYFKRYDDGKCYLSADVEEDMEDVEDFYIDPANVIEVIDI